MPKACQLWVWINKWTRKGYAEIELFVYIITELRDEKYNKKYDTMEC